MTNARKKNESSHNEKWERYNLKTKEIYNELITGTAQTVLIYDLISREMISKKDTLFFNEDMQIAVWLPIGRDVFFGAKRLQYPLIDCKYGKWLGLVAIDHTGCVRDFNGIASDIAENLVDFDLSVPDPLADSCMVFSDKNLES